MIRFYFHFLDLFVFNDALKFNLFSMIHASLFTVQNLDKVFDGLFYGC